VSKARYFQAYLLTCLATGKRYVGITTALVQRRWQEHISVSTRRTYPSALSEAIRKHGAGAFNVEPIASCRSWADLCATERALILQWGTFAPGGYNLTLGGEGAYGCRRSAESVERSAAKHRGRPCAVTTRAAASAYHRGRQKSAEHRAKIGASKVGKPRSAETRAKLSAYWSARRARGEFTTTVAYEHRRRP
jgi:group I intron endonuclease